MIFASFRDLKVWSIAALAALFPAIILFAQESNTTSPSTKYQGLIKGVPITMTLQTKGTAIIGTYQYVKVGKDLEVQGTMSSKDSIVLKEFDEKQRQTGLFKGRTFGVGFSTSGKADSIVGVWSRPDGSKSVPFILRTAGTLAPPTTIDFYSGRYKRSGKNSAEINVRRLADGTLKVEGEAYWMGNNDNVHTGDMSGIVSVKNFQAVYSDKNVPCKFTLTFGSDNNIRKASINVSGDDGNCGGMNVTFNGTYQRTSTTPVFRVEEK